MIRIDTPIEYSVRGRVAPWAHLWTDADEEELHAFARRIGLKRSWFQDKPRLPHYDVTGSKIEAARRAGAVLTNLGKWLIERRAKQ